MVHPALKASGVALITGAGAGGIGFATAKLLASRFGMKVILTDISVPALVQAKEQLLALGVKADHVQTYECDVTSSTAVESLAQTVYGSNDGAKVDLLLLNAGLQIPTSDFGNLQDFEKVMRVNFYGVLHGIHSFAHRMMAQASPAAIVVTGSKQGITQPPGNPAYNVSKSAVKSLTESLAHSLIGSQVSAHLLIPGYTYTKLTSGNKSLAGDDDKPRAAWTSDQVAEELTNRMEAEFYILCPDNDVSEALDFARIEYNVGDILHKRPALSRWHPDYAAGFAAHLKSKGL